MNNDSAVMDESLFSRGGLSLERLDSLCRLAEHGSLSKAADGDPVRQSQFSRQLRELGQFFGTDLTRRRGKGIELTQAGKELAIMSREILGDLEAFRRAQRGEANVVRIGAGESLIQWHVLPRLQALRKSMPNVLFVLKNLQGREISRQVMESELDFGLVGATELPAGMAAASLGTLRYALFVRRSVGRRLKWQAVLELPWVGLEGDGRLMQKMQEVAGRQNITLRPAVLCSSLPAVAEALTECNGFALLPESAGKEALLSVEAPFLRQFDRVIRLVWSERRIAVRGEMDRWREKLRAELAW